MIQFVHTTFQSVYQRNNKRGGLKNLRCFPDCAKQHKERGFCGRPVKVRVPFEADLVLWAQFLRMDQVLDPCNGVNPNVGEVVLESSLIDNERNQLDMTKPFIRGEQAQEHDVYEFNSKLKGWHYGWAANKHSCNAEHCFKVYAFEKCEGGKLVCRAVAVSSGFMLFCRRRRRFQVQPSAPIAPTQSSKNKTKYLDYIGRGCESPTATEDAMEPNAPIKQFPVSTCCKTNKRRRLSRAATRRNRAKYADDDDVSVCSISSTRTDDLLFNSMFSTENKIVEPLSATSMNNQSDSDDNDLEFLMQDVDFCELLDTMS